MKKKERITIISGIFDHPSITDVFRLRTAKANSDWLVVGVHSDERLYKKKITISNPYVDRRFFIENLNCVDEVFTYDDRTDNDIQLIKLVKICYPNAEIIYVSENPIEDIPESKMRGIKLAYIK
jgi:bifunctional ADP-heptose synthase (sugar kinase/adenylyltransferase)